MRARLVCMVLLAGCVAEQGDEGPLRIRLDLPRGSVKVIALGTGEIVPPEAAAEPRPRAASLALVVPSTHEVYAVDAHPDTAPLFGRLPVPAGFRAADAGLADAVLLTAVGPGTLAGLAVFAASLPADRALPVHALPAVLAALQDAAPPGLAVRLALRPALPGVTDVLGSVLQVTALPVAGAAHPPAGGWRLRGAARTLLYLPQVGPRADLPRPVWDALCAADVALLDAAARPAVRAGGALPPALQLRFVGPPPHAASPAFGEHARDGSEWWL